MVEPRSVLGGVAYGRQPHTTTPTNDTRCALLPCCLYFRAASLSLLIAERLSTSFIHSDTRLQEVSVPAPASIRTIIILKSYVWHARHDESLPARRCDKASFRKTGGCGQRQIFKDLRIKTKRGDRRHNNIIQHQSTKGENRRDVIAARLLMWGVIGWTNRIVLAFWVRLEKSFVKRCRRSLGMRTLFPRTVTRFSTERPTKIQARKCSRCWLRPS